MWLMLWGAEVIWQPRGVSTSLCARSYCFFPVQRVQYLSFALIPYAAPSHIPFNGVSRASVQLLCGAVFMFHAGRTSIALHHRHGFGWAVESGGSLQSNLLHSLAVKLQKHMALSYLLDNIKNGIRLCILTEQLYCCSLNTSEMSIFINIKYKITYATERHYYSFLK